MGSQDDQERKLEDDRKKMLAQRIVEVGELTAFMLDPDVTLDDTSIGRTIIDALGENPDDLTIVQLSALIINRCAEIMALETREYPSQILRTMSDMTRTAEAVEETLHEIASATVDTLLSHMRNQANLN